MDEAQYRKLKREVEEAKAASERAQGALDQLMGRLQEEFECKDVKSAKRLLGELQEKRDKAQETFDKAFKDYTRQWKKE